MASRRWTENTVDFGASDAFLKDSEIQAAAAKGEPVEIPTTFGAVVVAYNLKGLSAPIKMTPDIVAEHLPRARSRSGTTRRSPPRIRA